MEKDQEGRITRFEVGDMVEYQGEKYDVEPLSAINLNMGLAMVREGTREGVLAKGTISLRKSDDSGFMYPEVSHLDLFRQLPVDLSNISK